MSGVRRCLHDRDSRLDAANQHLGRVDERLDRLEAGQAKLEAGQVEIRKDLREIKQTVGLLHTIASDHENRIRQIEGALQDHLAQHHGHA